MEALRARLLVLCLGLSLAGAAGCQPEAAHAETKREPPSSWTDPRVLRELTKSCAFDPDDLPPAQRGRWIGELDADDESPLSCNVAMEQSCVYDPCFEEEEEACKPACTKTCQGCGKGCAARCEECKGGCKDDACRKACARGCGKCREACVRTRDRCATATCTAQYKVCRQKLRTSWRKNRCPQKCKTFQACEARCSKKKGPAETACSEACKQAVTGCNTQLCPDEDGMGIDPLGTD